MKNLSVVINAQNVEKDLERCLKSVKDLAGEIVVIDQESTDKTVQIAKKFGAKVYAHKKVPYVELARNFALSKAKGDWILLLDPDEEIEEGLKQKVEKELKNPRADYYRLPRKNIIFGKWIKHARWWPDYNIRLFKKGSVSWNEIIHIVPMTQGKGLDLELKEGCAIIHHNYDDIESYFEKMLRYTKAQQKNMIDKGYKFIWSDLISKPVNEFLSRFFAGQGYKDGLHGLVLSLLQAFSELVLYIRLWNYKEIDIKENEIKQELNKNMNDVKWWIRKEFSWLKNLVSH